MDESKVLSNLEGGTFDHRLIGKQYTFTFIFNQFYSGKGELAICTLSGTNSQVPALTNLITCYLHYCFCLHEYTIIYNVCTV